MTRARRYYIAETTALENLPDRIIARGAAALSDAELLAMFAHAPNSAVDFMRAQLTERGGLAALVQNPDALPNTTQARIAAALELSTRLLATELERGASLTDPGAAGRYCAQRLRAQPHEVFAALFLDTRHRVIAFEELFRGTVDGAEVHPRVVARRALMLNAAAVIVAHNHPSGNAEPSAADRAVTARLKQSLALVDVRLLDHFVIGDGQPVSLAARGWI